MKKVFAILLLLVAVLGISAQTISSRMTVVLKDGTSTTFNVNDIDSIAFSTESTTPVEPQGKKVYEVTAPAPETFTDSYVYKVMADGVQVAEVDLEYIPATKAQKVIIYPVVDGKADLTKGLSLTDGNTVAWDAAANTVTYEAGSSKLGKVYIVDGSVVTETAGDATATTLVADKLVDKRGGKEKEYKIVKIGTQYWMAENLAASTYRDGTAITLYTSQLMEAWKMDTDGAYHVYADDAEEISKVYGYMYNGYAVLSEKGLAPEGWEVPTYEQYTALKKFAGSAAVNYKSTMDNSWGESTSQNTNLTGFSALAAGFFNPAGDGDTNEGTETYWWTSTSKYDALSRGNAMVNVRLTAKGKSIVVSDLTTKDYLFGFYVRCIRK